MLLCKVTQRVIRKVLQKLAWIGVNGEVGVEDTLEGGVEVDAEGGVEGDADDGVEGDEYGGVESDKESGAVFV